LKALERKAGRELHKKETEMVMGKIRKRQKERGKKESEKAKLTNTQKDN